MQRKRPSESLKVIISWAYCMGLLAAWTCRHTALRLLLELAPCCCQQGLQLQVLHLTLNTICLAGA